MVVDDVQFINLFKGKRIKVTLRSSSYFGVVQRINANKTLVLADVVSCSNGCKLPGSKMFFGHEIVNVELAKEVQSDSGNHDERLEEHLIVERLQPYRKGITLDDDDEEEHVNFVVVDEFHEKFGPAVMHIKKQHVIGVGADGVDVFTPGRLCWLQIATNSKVYLFDILLLGARAFKNGLSMILENKDILKVIHDCRAIAGCLIAEFGVKLTNVFDTQVADVMCFYSETGGFLPNRVSTLQEVVSLHLKVPSSLLVSLKVKSQLTKEEKEIWFKRPCPVPLLKVMALSVLHLQPLRLVLLDTLMTDYMELVDSYLNSSQYEPDKIEHISMESILELPRELRQLEQMHRERQKWAHDHYPITKQGLLDRFNPRTLSQLQSQTIIEEQDLIKEQDSIPPQADSGQPAPLESLSTQVDHLQDSPTSLVKSTMLSSPFVDVPDSFSHPKGDTEILMDTIGRGRPLNESSTLSILPGRGRGFLLQMPPSQITQESVKLMNTPGRMDMASTFPSNVHSQEIMTQSTISATDLTKDTLSSKEDQSLSSLLCKSFRSFRL